MKWYNSIESTIVTIEDMRDTEKYELTNVWLKMIEIAQKNWYTDIEFYDKKVDKDGNIVSISLQWKSSKYGGCFVRLNFVKNCSYWEKSGSDETCIIEEYYDDDSFEMPFDAEVIYKYK